MKIKYLSILLAITTFVFSGISLANAQTFTENLYFGMRGDAQVQQLQEFLASQNLYSGPITGNFFFLTLSAVKAFQTQQGITPAAGYFGPVTMAAANKIADVEVGASNAQAISETGTSTPPVQGSSTVQLQLQALLQEVALLQQQLATQQSSTQAVQNLQTQVQQQTQTIQQQAQTLQQIASNTQAIATAPPQPSQPHAPTANFTVNGSQNSITIPYNAAATISWSSTNANSCNISPSGWSGTSGNQSTGNLTASQTYSLSCSGAGGSTSASVTVNVSAAPVQTTLGKIELSSYSPTTDATVQYNTMYTGSGSNLSIVPFDQNGNPITNASATITTDGSGQTTFTFKQPYVIYTLCVRGNCSTSSQPNGGSATYYYPFSYTPQTVGQHTITVSALGSTQSVTITSTPEPIPQVTITEDPTSLAAGNVVIGTTGNPLAIFRFTETSNLENVKLTDLTVTDTDSPAGAQPSFTNLTLWDGWGVFGTAGAPVPNATGNGYTYSFHFANPVVIIPQTNSVSLTLKGDLASPSSSIAIGSVHTFAIVSTSSVSANGAQNSLPATITLGGGSSAPTGNPQTVVSQ